MDTSKRTEDEIFDKRLSTKQKMLLELNTWKAVKKPRIKSSRPVNMNNTLDYNNMVGEVVLNGSTQKRNTSFNQNRTISNINQYKKLMI